MLVLCSISTYAARMTEESDIESLGLLLMQDVGLVHGFVSLLSYVAK